MTGWILAKIAAKIYAGLLWFRIIQQIDIKTLLRQHLDELYKAENRPRRLRWLSDPEMEFLQKTVRETYKREFPKTATVRFLEITFFSFFIGGIFLFYITLILLFHKTSLGDIITYIFQGEC